MVIPRGWTAPMNMVDTAVSALGEAQTMAAEKRPIADFLSGYSVETSPGAAENIGRFRDYLPAGTRVYIAALPGTDFVRVVETARRLRAEGLIPVPHLPARGLTGPDQLDTLLGRFGDLAGVREVLAIGGGVVTPAGAFDRTLQMLQTGLFEKHGIRRIGVAGHPEGNADIGDAGLDEALAQKNAFARATGIDLYIVTQFCFDARAVIAWDRAIRARGNRLPIHIGIAGPATLRSLVTYARLCGIGPSARMVRRQAMNLAKLAKVSAPDRLVTALARHRADDPACGITQAHFYTFGGLRRAALWLDAAVRGDFDWDSDREGFTANVVL